MNQNQKDRVTRAWIRSQNLSLSLENLNTIRSAPNPVRRALLILARDQDPLAQKPKYEDALVAAWTLVRGLQELDAAIADQGAIDQAYRPQDRATLNQAYRDQRQAQAQALGTQFTDPEINEPD